MNGSNKQRAPRNRTLTLSAQEEGALSKKLLRSPLPAETERLTAQVVCGDFIELLPQLPPDADLLGILQELAAERTLPHGR